MPINFNTEHCACCGAEIPEGRQYCPECERGAFKPVTVRKTRMTPRRWWRRNYWRVALAVCVLAIGALIIVLTKQALETDVFAATVTPTVAPYPTVTPTPTLDKPYYPLTDTERALVESVVAAESRGEPYIGQLAVAQTILDRAQGWGHDVTTVCTAEGQFAEPSNEVTESVKSAVSEVFDSGVRVTDERLYWFYAPKGERSRWHESKAFVCTVGGHRFFGEG